MNRKTDWTEQMEKISWDGLRNEIRSKFAELDEKAAGTVCRRCGKPITGVINEEDWVPEVHTNIPVTFCYDCKNYMTESMVIKDEDIIAKELFKDILRLCNLTVLQKHDDDIWEYFKDLAYEKSIGEDEEVKEED